MANLLISIFLRNQISKLHFQILKVNISAKLIIDRDKDTKYHFPFGL